MKQVIKIGLIIIVAAAIGFAIRTSLKVLEAEDSALLSSLNFEKVIGIQIDSIKGDYHPAKRAYDRIMGEITTEEFVTLGDGNKGISKSVADDCRNKANDKFAPIFTEYATKYFENPAWDLGEITAMQTTAQSMLKSTGSNSKHAGLLNSINTTTTGFIAAEGVIARAASCTTIASAGQIGKEAKAYSGYTLPINTRERLAAAPEIAKTKVMNYVISLCNNPKSVQGARNAKSLAQQYGETFGYNSSINNAITNAEDYIYRNTYVPTYYDYDYNYSNSYSGSSSSSSSNSYSNDIDYDY
ncbi:MAG: hypothetical protein IKJ52_04490 [Muribaculaceae bacterium]|nr:hypothetical protein [Muribaculaceae bacterium]